MFNGRFSLADSFEHADVSDQVDDNVDHVDGNADNTAASTERIGANWQSPLALGVCHYIKYTESLMCSDSDANLGYFCFQHTFAYKSFDTPVFWGIGSNNTCICSRNVVLEPSRRILPDAIN